MYDLENSFFGKLDYCVVFAVSTVALIVNIVYQKNYTVLYYIFFDKLRKNTLFVELSLILDYFIFLRI